MPEQAEETTQSLEQMLLDKVEGKYKLVLLAVRWAAEIKQREDSKGKQFPQLIEIALTELLTGQVTAKDVEKLPIIKKGFREDTPAADAASHNGSEKSKKEKK